MTVHVPAASDIPARAQMGATLGFHIVFACFGIAMPAVVLLAHWRGLRHGDAVSLLLARRWSKVMAVLFAVGAAAEFEPGRRRRLSQGAGSGSRSRERQASTARRCSGRARACRSSSIRSSRPGIWGELRP